jgi:hypothetical protein
MLIEQTARDVAYAVRQLRRDLWGALIRSA